jgi:adenine deaminase
MVREGSTARNLEALLPLLDELRPSRALFVTDDRDPVDLAARGHVDSMVRAALDFGLDPVLAIRLASYNAAQYFGLDDCGAIAPGYRADLLVVDDLQSFSIGAVYKDGLLVAQHGEPLFTVTEFGPAGSLTNSIHIAPIAPEQLRLPGCSGPALVIGIEPGQITTRRLIEDVEARHGYIMADPDRDLLKLVAVERHHATGRIGLGLVKGFGLRRGALASSVAHDAHNLIVVGADDGDILRAIAVVQEMGGGFAVAAGDTVVTVQLPLGGLVSPQPIEILAAQLDALDRTAAALGCPLEHPCMTLSFLSLTVIPELRLTDRGLVDVSAGQLIPVGVIP